MAKRHPCPICGSTKWRKHPGGNRACEEGHVDTTYRKETAELGGEPSQSQLRIRRVKTDKKKKVPKNKGREEIYHGHEKEFVYYESLQLLIRHQVKALRTVWGLPVELEIITRDLLSLALLLRPLPPAPEPELPLSAPSPPRPKLSSPALGMEGIDLETPVVSSSKLLRDEDSEDDGADAMIRALEQAHEDSATDDEPGDAESEVERGDGGDPVEAQERTGRKKRRADGEVAKVMRPMDCLAILIVGCWTLRVPVMFKEFISLINSHQLPYLEFANSVLFPADLRNHFEQELFRTLNPAWAPSVMKLYRRTSDIALHLHDNFGIKIPELNASPVIWKCIRSMGGSPALYPAVISLSRTIQLHFSLHRSLAPNAVSVFGMEEDHRLLGDRSPPELTIMAVVVIVLKMVYGLDGRDRLPVNYEDMATVLMGKKEWLDGVRTMRRMEKGEFPDEKLQEGSTDILALEGDDIDRYLDFASTILASGYVPPRHNRSAQTLLTSRFPPAPAPPNSPFPHDPPSTHSFPHRFHNPPTPLDVLPPGPILPTLPDDFDLQHRFETLLLPGEAYPRFSRLDTTGEMPKEMELVMEDAAKVVGVKKEELAWVLELMELRLGRGERGGKGRRVKGSEGE